MKLSSKEHYIFLIGGYDLEMVTIRNILKQYNIPFVDKQLEWGASWKDYLEILTDPQYVGKTFIGIELREKNLKPYNAIDIDHHNFNTDKPSSLEQVIAFINEKGLTEKEIPFTKEFKIISVNDKDYIPGLLNLCLDREKIQEIRRKDRACQGITPEQDREAKKFVDTIPQDKLNCEVIILEIPENIRFSSVRDYLFLDKNIHQYRKLILYNNTEVNYYGPLAKLEKKYEKDIKEGKAYLGGKIEYGFLGIPHPENPRNEVKKINQLLLNKPHHGENNMHSYHIFLFPFRWKNIFDTDKQNKNADLNQKFDLNIFEQKLEVSDENGNIKTESDWERSKFKLDNPVNYNEYNYFYDFVREILYDLDETLRTETNVKNENLIRHYSYKPADINKNKRYYHIKTKQGEHYALEIDSILLNIYGTGVGILSFHMRNRDYPDPEDILKINQFGRRIYPSFFGLCDNSIYTGKKEQTPFNKQISDAKNELADAIWIDENKDALNPPEIQEKDEHYDFTDYLKEEFYKHGPFKLPRFIKDLFPENFFAEHWKAKENKKVYIRPGLDDRMFVISWYGNDGLSNYLSNYHCESYNYETDDWWYKYVFVDTQSPMVANRKMKRKLIEKHTYERWVEWGTFYGMSRYSLVMLTGSSSPAFLIRHLQTMYYKMAELALLQRISVVAFSDEVTHISDLVHQKDDDKIIERIQELYAMYILFVNKIYFREITAQEQGIEMYDKLHKVMRIPEHVKDLDSELDELNRYATMLEQKRENKEMKKHTCLATIFLPPMLISGILGMNLFETKKDIPAAILSDPAHWFWWPLWILFILILLFISMKNKKSLICILKLAFWGSLLLLFINYYFMAN